MLTICITLVQVNPEGLGNGEGADISPTSGTVELLEGVTSAWLILSVIDDQVCCSI